MYQIQKLYINTSKAKNYSLKKTVVRSVFKEFCIRELLVHVLIKTIENIVKR